MLKYRKEPIGSWPGVVSSVWEAKLQQGVVSISGAGLTGLPGGVGLGDSLHALQ